MRWRPLLIVHLRLPYLTPPALLPRRSIRAAVCGVCTGGGAQVIVSLDCLEELADEALGAVGEEVAEALLEVLLQLRLTLHLFAQQHHHVVRERRRVRGRAASREQEAAVSRWGRGDGGRREAQGQASGNGAQLLQPTRDPAYQRLLVADSEETIKRVLHCPYRGGGEKIGFNTAVLSKNRGQHPDRQYSLAYEARARWRRA